MLEWIPLIALGYEILKDFLKFCKMQKRRPLPRTTLLA